MIYNFYNEVLIIISSIVIVVINKIIIMFVFFFILLQCQISTKHYNPQCGFTRQAGSFQGMHTCIHVYMHTCIHAYMHIYIHNGLPLEDTRLLGKLAIPVCRHLLKHGCTVFTQHPQSQLVVYTAIIAEQTVITVSENECIYQCDQELNDTGTLNPSVTIICDIVQAQPPMDF